MEHAKQNPESYDLATSKSPTTGDEYTHAIIETVDGARTIMEIAPIEMEIAHDEIVRAIVEKRPHVVVLHPITDGGEQLSFYGTITGITRITAAHAEEMKKTRDEAAERNEAQRQLLLGRTPGRRGVLG